ncbi:MAG: MFS transporter [Chloroflexota bacterium]
MPATFPSPVPERLFVRDFVFITVANFVNSFGSQMLMATLPVYVIVLGGSAADAGLVTGTLAFTALLLRPPIGWVADVWRRRPLIILGTACYGLASVVYLLASSVPVLLLGRAVHGFGLSNYTTASSAYVADLAPPRRRAEAVGLFGMAQAVGLITGPAIGFLLVDSLGFHTMFVATAVLSFAACAIAYFTRERPRLEHSPRPTWSLRKGIVSISALPLAWTTLCLGTGFGPVNSFIAIYASSHGIANPGLFFTVQALALIVSRPLAGRLADQRGRKAVLVPGVIMAALGIGILPLATDWPIFLLAAALYGAGFGASQPATMALIIDRVSAQERGMAMSTYFTGFDLGISISSYALGIVVEAWGFGPMWLIAAATTLLGLFGLLPGRSGPKPSVVA